jgi:hypothetical protein
MKLENPLPQKASSENDIQNEKRSSCVQFRGYRNINHVQHYDNCHDAVNNRLLQTLVSVQAAEKGLHIVIVKWVKRLVTANRIHVSEHTVDAMGHTMVRAEPVTCSASTSLRHHSLYDVLFSRGWDDKLEDFCFGLGPLNFGFETLRLLGELTGFRCAIGRE